jgi:hypothetical protein
VDADRIFHIAGMAHEMNRRWCELCGDPSQIPWEEAPGWQTQSAMKGVRAVLDGATPAELHAAWVREKEAEGWGYGPQKDPEKRVHPCMVPYSDLPPEQKAKDAIFIAVVEGLR